MSFINDQPTVETSIYDYIEVNGRISKKLFEKIIIPKLESITQKDARIAELESDKVILNKRINELEVKAEKLTDALECFGDETQEWYVDHYKAVEGQKVGIIKSIVQLGDFARKALADKANY